MAAEAKFEVGDVIRMKKPHPCGSSEWEILRVGADFRLKCRKGSKTTKTALNPILSSFRGAPKGSPKMQVL